MQARDDARGEGVGDVRFRAVRAESMGLGEPAGGGVRSVGGQHARILSSTRRCRSSWSRHEVPARVRCERRRISCASNMRASMRWLHRKVVRPEPSGVVLQPSCASRRSSRPGRCGSVRRGSPGGQRRRTRAVVGAIDSCLPALRHYQNKTERQIPLFVAHWPALSPSIAKDLSASSDRQPRSCKTPEHDRGAGSVPDCRRGSRAVPRRVAGDPAHQPRGAGLPRVRHSSGPTRPRTGGVVRAVVVTRRPRCAHRGLEGAPSRGRRRRPTPLTPLSREVHFLEASPFEVT